MSTLKSYLSIAFLCSLATFALADDAALEAAGGSIRPMHAHPSVRMVSEVVRIKLPECKVEATFILRNEGDPVSVLIGFPEQGKDTTPRRDSHFEGFRSWVDGKPIAVKREVQQAPDDDYEYKYWWVKHVDFTAGQTRTIVNRYSGGWFFTSYGVSGFDYILRSGATWKGPIGHATIICEAPGLKYSSPKLFLPLQWRKEGETRIWEKSDFKPDEDVQIRWFDGFMNVAVDGKPVANDRDGKPWGDEPATWGWNEEYGRPRPRRIGDEVWVTAKTAAAWLEARLNVISRGRGVRLSLRGRSADFTVGSANVLAGSRRINLPGMVRLEDDSIVIPLRALVDALGGQSHFEAGGRLVIQRPSMAGTERREFGPAGRVSTESANRWMCAAVARITILR